jgi:large subunit ribosomal protein L29
MFKAKDLRERTVEDLRELQKTLASEAFQARFKNFTNRLDDTSSIRKARKDLARVLTVLNERTRGITPVARLEGEARQSPKPPKAAKPKKAAAPKAEAKAAPAAAPSKPAKKTAAKKTAKKSEAK